MKRILPLLLALLLLCGCAGGAESTKLQVTLVETGGFTVEKNGLWITPGGDAVFRLKPDPGFALAGTDYSGDIQIRASGEWTELTVRQVDYPTRIRLTLTEDFVRITYDPNGGAGERTTVYHPGSSGTRPNTSNGRDLFTREGHTLTGWNTASDGSGQRIGLGSRVTATREGVTLYAQWEAWCPESDFTWTDGVYLTITGYHGDAERLVIPEAIGGKAVGAIAHNAFRDCRAKELVLPSGMVRVAEGAFTGCSFESVTLFDSIETVSNSSFRDCSQLTTLYINAYEQPYGYLYRKESVYADKADLLIRAAGQRKLVFYGGCSVWYNLDGSMAEEALGEEYRILNLGLNGTVNSHLQLLILQALMEPGDVLFHTPELTSKTQMMGKMTMGQEDDKLWSGLEQNYDLIALVDFQSVSGLLESFCQYLSRKGTSSGYPRTYLDSQGRSYLDTWGCIPFQRTETAETLSDPVSLDPACVDEAAMGRLEEAYRRFTDRGIRVYVGYACVNLDAVPEEERGNAPLVDALFREAVEAMDGPVLISRLEDYLYTTGDFYDTNYHLLSGSAARNTELWLRDLAVQIEADNRS